MIQLLKDIKDVQMSLRRSFNENDLLKLYRLIEKLDIELLKKEVHDNR